MNILKWIATPEAEELIHLVITYYDKGKQTSTSYTNYLEIISNTYVLNGPLCIFLNK